MGELVYLSVLDVSHWDKFYLELVLVLVRPRVAIRV